MTIIEIFFKEFGNKIDIENWSLKNIHREYTFQAILMHCQMTCTGLLKSYLENDERSIDEIRFVFFLLYPIIISDLQSKSSWYGLVILYLRIQINFGINLFDKSSMRLKKFASSSLDLFV